MALAVVDTNASSNVDSQAVTVTFTASAGDTVIVFGGGASGAGPSVTTSGYTLIGSDTTQRELYVWKKVMGSTPDTEVVCDISAGSSWASAFGVAVISGSPNTFTIDFTTGLASLPEPPTIGAPKDSIVVVGYLLGYDSVATTAPAGFSNLASDGALDTNRAGVGVATKAITATGAESPGTFDGTGNRDWVAFSLTVSAANIIATDDFNRADAGSLGSNWDDTADAGAMTIVSNAAVVDNTAGNDGRAIWVADSFHPDQWAEVDVTLTGVADASDAAVVLRGAPGSLAGYRFKWEPTVGGGQYSIFYSDDTGADTLLASSADGIGETGTRRLRFEAFNSGVDDVRLSAYVDGKETLVITHNAAQTIQAGHPGILTDSTTATKPILDNFAAGDWASDEVYPVQVCEAAQTAQLTGVLTWPTRPRAGNLLVVAVGSRHNFATYDSCTSGFTLVETGQNTSTLDHTSIFVAVADGTSAYNTFTITYANTTDTAILIGAEFHSTVGSFSGYTVEDTSTENHVTAISDTLPALTIANPSLVFAAVGSRTTAATNPILWTGLPRVEWDNVATSSSLGVGWGLKSADYTPEWTFAASDTTIGAAAVAIRAPVGSHKPTGVTATPVDADSITIAWTAVSGASGYDVQRGSSVIATDVAGTSYTDNSADINAEADYRVRAVI